MVGQAGVTAPVEACGILTCLFLQLISEGSEPGDVTVTSSRPAVPFTGWGMKYSEGFRAIQCLPWSRLMNISEEQAPEGGPGAG